MGHKVGNACGWRRPTPFGPCYFLRRHSDGLTWRRILECQGVCPVKPGMELETVRGGVGIAQPVSPAARQMGSQKGHVGCQLRPGFWKLLPWPDVTSGGCSWLRQGRGPPGLRQSPPRPPHQDGLQSWTSYPLYGQKRFMANSSLSFLRSSEDLACKFRQALSSNPQCRDLTLGANGLSSPLILYLTDLNPEKYYDVYSRSHFEPGNRTWIYFWSGRMLQISCKESKPDSKTFVKALLSPWSIGVQPTHLSQWLLKIGSIR